MIDVANSHLDTSQTDKEVHNVEEYIKKSHVDEPEGTFSTAVHYTRIPERIIQKDEDCSEED